MRASIKKITDRILNPLGLNLERFFGHEISIQQLALLAKEQDIDLVLDIGANTGQFAKSLMKAGYAQKILSFEPLSAAYRQLIVNAQKYRQWQVFERCAIGDFDGTVDINIAENSHSSSILNVTQVHTGAAPSATAVDKETVKIKKLDSLTHQIGPYKNILLKIDTQGFEKNVLIGAPGLLNTAVKVIQLEMSLLPLYDGAPLFEEMVKYLREIGFEPLFYSPGYVDRLKGHIQQLEGYFVKSR